MIQSSWMIFNVYTLYLSLIYIFLGLCVLFSIILFDDEGLLYSWDQYGPIEVSFLTNQMIQNQTLLLRVSILLKRERERERKVTNSQTPSNSQIQRCLILHKCIIQVIPFKKKKWKSQYPIQPRRTPKPYLIFPLNLKNLSLFLSQEYSLENRGLQNFKNKNQSTKF